MDWELFVMAKVFVIAAGVVLWGAALTVAVVH